MPLSDEAWATFAGEFELTRRQLEVARLLAQGKSAKWVSRKLGISAHTVRAHRRLVYLKCSVHSHPEMAAKILDFIIEYEAARSADTDLPQARSRATQK